MSAKKYFQSLWLPPAVGAGILIKSLGGGDMSPFPPPWPAVVSKIDDCYGNLQFWCTERNEDMYKFLLQKKKKKKGKKTPFL